MTFRMAAEASFGRIVRGYADALDDTMVRSWLGGHRNAHDVGGTWIAAARMFPALAAWLADPANSSSLRVRGQAYDVESLARAVLERALDPEHPGFWLRDEQPATDQRTVESSALAYGAWLLRDTLIPTLSDEARSNAEKWLTHFASGPMVRNNWSLFWIVNHQARLALGWGGDTDAVADAWSVIDGLERADGWMTDGGDRGFDDYNWWVFGSHELWWIDLVGGLDAAGDQGRRIASRVRRRLEDLPYFFGADGSYSEFGRSLSYKFGRLGAPLLAYRLGLWPHGPGLLKRIVRLHLEHYETVGAVDPETGVIRQCLSAHGHPDVIERYIDTGHPYWCMHLFTALWQIPADDPFWTCDEEPLPCEMEGAAFRRVVKAPGWILSGGDGQVMRHSLGTERGGAKYAKFAYGTHFPIDVGAVDGDYGPDAALCASLGDDWAHPAGFERFAVDDDGEWLRAIWILKLESSGVDVNVETVLIPEAVSCVRVHRVGVPASAADPVKLIEGASALGFAAGANVSASFGPTWSAAAVDGRLSQIESVLGWDGARRPRGFRGHDDRNAVYAFSMTPILEAEIQAGEVRVLACVAQAAVARRREIGQATTVEWGDDDVVRVGRAGAASVAVPPLSPNSA